MQSVNFAAVRAGAGADAGAARGAGGGTGATVTGADGIDAPGVAGAALGTVCTGSGVTAPQRCSAKVARYCWRDGSAATSLPAAFWKSIPNHSTGMNTPATPATTFCATLAPSSEPGSATRPACRRES